MALDLAPAAAVKESPRLTSLSSCGGCGAKLPAADLFPLIRELPRCFDPRVLVCSATGDDAAVVRLAENLALVQTVDFFTPLVDDPYDFGRIAAANALSDVYAMGARPLTALNIVAFPLHELGDQALRKILRGGGDVVRQAGAALVGGHSIRDHEPKYGLAVTGIVDPRAITTNASARDGDLLVLSKPLGTGAIVTAHMHGSASESLLAEAVEVMVTLNDRAARAALGAGVRAMTDITGFGLLGHLHVLCKQSGLAAEVQASAVPAIPGVEKLLGEGVGISSGSRRNVEWAATFSSTEVPIEPWRMRLLTDATTSGGLLMAVPPASVGASLGATIGRLHDGPSGAIEVR